MESRKIKTCFNCGKELNEENCYIRFYKGKNYFDSYCKCCKRKLMLLNYYEKIEKRKQRKLKKLFNMK